MTFDTYKIGQNLSVQEFIAWALLWDVLLGKSTQILFLLLSLFRTDGKRRHVPLNKACGTSPHNDLTATDVGRACVGEIGLLLRNEFLLTAGWLPPNKFYYIRRIDDADSGLIRLTRPIAREYQQSWLLRKDINIFLMRVSALLISTIALITYSAVNASCPHWKCTINRPWWCPRGIGQDGVTWYTCNYDEYGGCGEITDCHCSCVIVGTCASGCVNHEWAGLHIFSQMARCKDHSSNRYISFVYM